MEIKLSAKSIKYVINNYNNLVLLHMYLQILFGGEGNEYVYRLGDCDTAFRNS